jgi:hypothetical protein
MTTHSQIRLRQTIKDNGKVSVTAVDEEGKVTEYTFTNFDEAKSEIEFLEIEHEVYF